jgi:molecular chaperone HtpG
MTESSVHQFQAEVSQVLRLVIRSLYSNHDIFLRELISNASDALDRLRFRGVSEPELLPAGERLRIRLIPDRKNGTLTIWDNGVGMTREELSRALGTVAWSGSREFLEKLRQAQGNDAERLDLIGQFGVGFYSAFLVADEVSVVSRAAGTAEAHRWVSRAEQTYTIERAEREQPGTSVVLHLKDEHKDVLEQYRLKALVSRYSDYIAHPIELTYEKEDPNKEPQTVTEVVNQASALWQRQPKDVEEAQYEEFYKHLTHDYEGPLVHRHFHIEGTHMFSGLLFVPRRPPFDLFDPEPRHGVRLHVKRVFVMDDCEELVPRWLRFVRGVIDSEDLPLNVSREVLQDSRAVRIIRKQVVTQTLEVLEELASDRPEDYTAFFRAFGAVLKEGLHFDPDQRDRIAKLLRYESSAREGFVSLTDYVAAMKEGQNAIYYAAGTSRAVLEGGPHLEKLRQADYEILFMTDPVDPFAVSSLEKFDGKPLISAMNAELELGAQNEPKDKPSQASESFLDHVKEVLGGRVGGVRASGRLTDSPACLVVPEGGLAPHIERLLRAQKVDLPTSKRIFELNLGHPLVVRLAALHGREAGSEKLKNWIDVLYDQALLAEGSPVENPALFARRLSELLTQAAAAEAEPPA